MKRWLCFLTLMFLAGGALGQLPIKFDPILGRMREDDACGSTNYCATRAELLATSNALISADADLSNAVVALYIAADAVVLNAATTADGNLSNAVVTLYSAADAMISNAFVAADTDLSNNAVALYQAADILVSNAFVAADAALSNSMVALYMAADTVISNAFVAADSALSTQLLTVDIPALGYLTNAWPDRIYILDVNGQSRAEYADLVSALAAGTDGETIVVGPGWYESGGPSPNYLPNNVDLVGAGPDATFLYKTSIGPVIALGETTPSTNTIAGLTLTNSHATGIAIRNIRNANLTLSHTRLQAHQTISTSAGKTNLIYAFWSEFAGAFNGGTVWTLRPFGCKYDPGAGITVTSDLTDPWLIDTDGNMIPYGSNVCDIGSADRPIGDLYMGSNSLYMFGQKVMAYSNDKVVIGEPIAAIDIEIGQTNVMAEINRVETNITANYTRTNDTGLLDWSGASDVFVPAPTVSSNPATMGYVDSKLVDSIEFFLQADYTLTTNRADLAVTNTSVFLAGVTNNQHIFFKSASNITDVILVGEISFHYHASADEDNGVSWQVEPYYSNSADGMVEFAIGDGTQIPKKDRILDYNQHAYNTNSTLTNMPSDTEYYAALIILDPNARTPDVTIYMEGQYQSVMRFPETVGAGGGGRQWSTFPALVDVNANQKTITNNAPGVLPADLPTMAQMAGSNTLASILATDPNAGGIAITNITERCTVYYSATTQDVSMTDSGWTYIFDALEGQAVFIATNLTWDATNLWQTHYIDKGTGSQLIVVLEDPYTFSRFPSNTIASIATNSVNTMTVKQGGSNWVVGVDMGMQWQYGVQP